MDERNSSGSPSGEMWDARWLIATAIVVVVLALWCLMGLIAWNQKEPGVFGDMFGANALFSGLAFAGLIYAILLQRQELSLQRKELAETRRELEAQNAHFADQNRTLRQTATDATFFQLLRLHNDIVNAIDLGTKDAERTIARGRDCFKIFFRAFKTKVAERRVSKAGQSDHEWIQQGYSAFYNEHQADVGHYFRSLYNIVKFVDRSDLGDKRIYTNLIRAQLSSYEQTLLFYNCLSPLGEDKFKPLVEQYGLLKSPAFDLLIEESHKMHFAAKAFA